jgi:hypothetical protein
MRVLYIIFVLCTLAVIGVALGLWRYLRRHGHHHGHATPDQQAHERIPERR